ncbi:MAG TPA: lipid-binding SYLF domain-containing protein [Polyangia bacterium]|nr:lipid-binding SYLF domain-containing protein [Polyangia bacterium]
MKTKIGIVVAALALGFAAAANANEAQLVSEANATKGVFIKTDPGLAQLFQTAPGYVVFPSIGKAALGVGGAHGTGIVYEQGRPVGKASLSQLTVGAQIGGQAYSEVILFETPEALAHFKQGKMAFSGQVSAVALQAGASADARYKEGVMVFTATKGGLMLEASIGGQKFGFEPFVTR